MEPHTLIGLGFLGLFLFMCYRMFTKNKTQTNFTSPNTTSAALTTFQKLLNNTPPKPATEAAAAKAQAPSRNDAIQAILVLVDFANKHELPEVAKAITDQLPAVALRKGD